MALYLDSHFWVPWLRKHFPLEIETLREALIEQMLPSLPDANLQAQLLTEAVWEEAVSHTVIQPYDEAALADWATERGAELYGRLVGVRQSILNMATVMLWHLLEQQILVFSQVAGSDQKGMRGDG